MVVGKQVRVFPHGHPELTGLGKVLIAARNGCSIAVRFDTIPPFVRGKTPAVYHPVYGCTIFLYRPVAWVPWEELMGGGHYEVEDVSEEEG